MGMTIAEPIQTLEDLRERGILPYSTVDEVLHRAESIDVAINTMRKYQKIEQIIADDWEKGFQHSETVARIREALNCCQGNEGAKV